MKNILWLAILVLIMGSFSSHASVKFGCSINGVFVEKWTLLEDGRRETTLKVSDKNYLIRLDERELYGVRVIIKKIQNGIILQRIESLDAIGYDDTASGVDIICHEGMDS